MTCDVTSLCVTIWASSLNRLGLDWSLICLCMTTTIAIDNAALNRTRPRMGWDKFGKCDDAQSEASSTVLALLIALCPTGLSMRLWVTEHHWYYSCKFHHQNNADKRGPALGHYSTNHRHESCPSVIHCNAESGDSDSINVRYRIEGLQGCYIVCCYRERSIEQKVLQCTTAI